MNVVLERKNYGIHFFIFFIFLIAISLFLFTRLESVFEEKALHAAEENAIAAINEASEKTFRDFQSSELVSINREESGKITSVSANTAEMNKLKNNLAKELQAYSKTAVTSKITVPIGSLTGFSAFQGTGFRIPIKIFIDGIAKVDFDEEFTDAGINQVKHKIFMTVSVKMSVISAVSSKSKIVETQIPVAETVILGTAPNYYGENLNVIGR